jgi:pimeloyl-ACP methyl ester carboxylesterase
MDSQPPSRRPASIPAATSIFPSGTVHGTVTADDGTRLFVESRDGEFAADAPRLFLCDGILCDGFIWKYAWDELATLGPITHWHYRGHGRSAPPADPDKISVEQHAADLMRVRESVGNPPAILVGHSMGCQVILESYRQNPENVRALVLICGTFGKVTATFRGLPILDLVLPKLVDTVLKHEELARAVWTRISPEMVLKLALRAGDLDPDKVRSEDMLPYLKHMTHVDLPMFLKMLRAAGEHSAEAWLGDIKVPTLIIAGERDTFTPAFLARGMAAAIPESELVVVERGSHVVPIEQPEMVNTRLVEFVRSRVLA